MNDKSCRQKRKDQAGARVNPPPATSQPYALGIRANAKVAPTAAIGGSDRWASHANAKRHSTVTVTGIHRRRSRVAIPPSSPIPAAAISAPGG